MFRMSSIYHLLVSFDIYIRYDVNLANFAQEFARRDTLVRKDQFHYCFIFRILYDTRHWQYHYHTRVRLGVMFCSSYFCVGLCFNDYVPMPITLNNCLSNGNHASVSLSLLHKFWFVSSHCDLIMQSILFAVKFWSQRTTLI